MSVWTTTLIGRDGSSAEAGEARQKRLPLASHAAEMGEYDIWMTLGVVALVAGGLLATRKPIPMFRPARRLRREERVE
jgi:hypothetical protein